MSLNDNYVDVSLDEIISNDINVKLIENADEIDGYETCTSVINIVGKTVNHVIVNTLRRVILSLIPIYGFDASNINITKNTSVFNNDMMRLRLSNFPVYFSKNLNSKYKNLKKIKYDQIINPDNSLSFAKELEYRANLGSAELDVTLDNTTQNITNNLTIIINVKNTSENDIMDVTTMTPGVKFYFEKEQISHIYANPLLIIQLQPGQEFVCTMISSLNIGLYNAIYRPCSMCHYEQLHENSYNLTVKSRRQINEKDIIIRACKIIKEKIKNSESVIIENISNYSKHNNIDDLEFSTEHLRNGTIVIEGEQHTMGNLISRFMQDHQNITYAGYKVGHPNVNQVEIEYSCRTDIIAVIKDVCRSIISTYDNIENKVLKMNAFGYQYNN